MGEKIVVLDFGGQYTHLIANRIRRLNVYSEILPCDIEAEKIKDAKGIILSGGPASVYEKSSPKCGKELFKLGIPVLGLCYGHQLMAQLLGGKVKLGKTKEYGIARLKIANKKDLFCNLKDEEIVWMSHGDKVSQLPDGFEVLASTLDCPIAAMGNGLFFGLQFHPEVTHTPNGMKILENFVFSICSCKKAWTMANFVKEKIAEIKEKVKDKKVFLLASGGVDSTVCFCLLNSALGPERVLGLHIDNGFMRKDESELVKKSLACFENLHVVDASEEFLEEVKGVADPEEKRAIIGEKFVKVKDKAVKELNLDQEEWILGQGTIYPDTIESKGTKNADLIKTHHNRVGIIQELIKSGKIIEPIALLYKDEVRQLGIELGLPKQLIFRHPFPGPGLAVRCLCAEKEDYPVNVDEVEEKVNFLIAEHNLKAKVLPIKSVGVQGDARTYRHPVVLIGNFPGWNALEQIATRITNKIAEVNRVLLLVWPYDIAGIKVKKAYLTRQRLDLLREADAIAMKALADNNLMQEVWQMPTVLLPLTLGGGESAVLRPVYSKEAMTAQFAKIPIEVVQEIASEVKNLGFDAVFYDITNKPPGTIEWE